MKTVMRFDRLAPMAVLLLAALAPTVSQADSASGRASSAAKDAMMVVNDPYGPGKLGGAVSGVLGSAATAVASAPAPPPPTTPPAPAAHKDPIKRRLAPQVGPQPVDLRIEATASGEASRVLNLQVGKSAVVELPADAKDVLVTSPTIADAVLRSRRRISVLGLAAGATDAVFFDDAGKRILSLDIRVGKDSGGLSDAIDRLLPGAKVRVESVNDSLVLAGEVSSAADAAKAQHLAERFVGKPEQVVNLLTITGKEQVMLKVRIVEMQRSIIKQLGFNTGAVINQVGMPQYSFANAATYGVNGALLGGLTGGYKADTTQQPVLSDPNNDKIHFVARNAQVAPNYQTATTMTTSGSNGLNQANSMVQAFERVGLVRTLAEPNLTAISGESAKFLAGGEFPVPVGEDATGRVTVEFKPYGVGLGFTPVVMSEGRISMKISAEVSELTTAGGFTLTASPNTSSSSSGAASPVVSLNVPGLTVRRTETTVELPSGGAMMIAGLLQQQTKQNIDSLPGMTNLPVLGALFRSRDYQSGETELVVIVTPYLVKPTSPDKLQTPVDGLEIASDIETDLLGKLNRSSKVPPAAVAGKTLQGPYGYVIE
jgi:pilus assembly protein CpaC